jgi:hypothetical protein
MNLIPSFAYFMNADMIFKTKNFIPDFRMVSYSFKVLHQGDDLLFRNLTCCHY